MFRVFALCREKLFRMTHTYLSGVNLNTSTAVSLFFLMLVVACGGGGKSVNKIKFGAGEKLTAENPRLAPDPSFREGMGLLLIRKSSGLSVCTSFLVSPKILMTNSHCVSGISLTDECSNNVAVHVKTPAGYEFKKCSRIISRSQIGEGTSKPDFAVIELDSPVSAIGMNLSREGVIEGAELTIESVDYTQSDEGILYGKKKISKCSPHTNTALGNYAVPKSSIIPLFGDTSQSCKIIKGNSGSPVFNSANKVVSILFATFDRDELAREIGHPLNRNMALATNLACIRSGISTFDAQRAIDCDQVIRDEARYFERLGETVEHGGTDARRKKSELMRSLLPTAFEFDFEEKKKDTDGMKYSFSYKPRCMKKPSFWSDEEKLKIRTSETNVRRYSSNISDYAFGIKIVYDEYIRPSAESSVVPDGGYELIVDDIDVAGNSVLVKLATISGARVVNTTKVIPLCR